MRGQYLGSNTLIGALRQVVVGGWVETTRQSITQQAASKLGSAGHWGQSYFIDLLIYSFLPQTSSKLICNLFQLELEL